MSKTKNGSGGWPSIKSGLTYLFKEKAFWRGSKSLIKLNKKQGIDCPGCAWPDPDPTSVAEFCENGMKAIAAETTSKKIDADFFKRHSIEFLNQQNDYWLEQQGRLTEPMYKPKNSNHYQPISWDKALDIAAKNLSKLQNINEAVFYTSGRTSNEAAFLYQLLGRQLGTNNFPDCSNLCHESSGVALKKSIGIGKGTVNLEDFHKADLIVLMGQNPATNHPRMLTDLQKAAKNGAKIVAINPLKEKGLMSFTHPQDLINVLKGKATALTSTYIQPKIGGDLAMLIGVCKDFFEKEYPLDSTFIEKETSGFEKFKDTVTNTPWEHIINDSGVSKKEIEELSELYHQSDKTIICWAMGITQHREAVATIEHIVNLLLLKGNIGKEGAGACPVRGHSNVQGDRTMGIHEAPPESFLQALDNTFSISSPRKHGYNAVNTIKAMATQKVKFFMSMGGNFISASPDTDFTSSAMNNCDITIQVSTKLNRSHLVTGKEALILPTYGRTEVYPKGKVSVEDSMSMVHLSQGRLKPISEKLMHEPKIVAEIGERIFNNSPVEWNKLGEDYNYIRQKIASTVQGFENYNEKLNQGPYFLGNSAKERVWNTTTGKANFSGYDLSTNLQPNNTQFTMMTVRSHDQYNTTVYGLNDRYRGVSNERKVVFMNPIDMSNHNFKENDIIDLTSIDKDGKERKASGFKVIPYEIKTGCLASYFPETNVLVPLDNYAKESYTPMSKYIPVNVEKSSISL